MTNDKWCRLGKVANEEGSTIIYMLCGSDITVESRKRHIPHADRSGTWDFTSYFVLKNGESVCEKYSLADAKQCAEEMAAKGDNDSAGRT